MMHLLQILLLLFVPAVTGTLVVRHAIGRARGFDTIVGLLPLGVGLGLGLSGLLAFVSLAFVDSIVLTWEIALCLLVVLVSTQRKKWPTFRASVEAPTPAARLVVLGTVLLMAACAWGYLIQTRQTPYGGWDAWDFWNTRALFFHRGGEDWVNTFSQIPWWTHPEYPVLLPAMVARGFRVLNAEAALVPMLIGFVFTFAAIATLYFGVSHLRGRTQGLLAAAVLCCTPYFMFHGTEQYADNPLSFFILATVVCASLYDQNREGASALVLSGLFAGLATFVKNEGIMFVSCFVLARSVWVVRNQGRREWKAQAWSFALGALPGVLATALFKSFYAVMPDNAEFYAAQWKDWDHSFIDHVVLQASDAARYRGFFRAWWHNLTLFDEWVIPLVVILPVYGVVMGRFADGPKSIVRSMLGTFLLQAVGVSVLFLLWSTYEIFEHMDALGRLLTQMLPTVLFVMFVSVRTPWSVTLAAPRAESVKGE